MYQYNTNPFVNPNGQRPRIQANPQRPPVLEPKRDDGGNVYYEDNTPVGSGASQMTSRMSEFMAQRQAQARQEAMARRLANMPGNGSMQPGQMPGNLPAYIAGAAQPRQAGPNAAGADDAFNRWYFGGGAARGEPNPGQAAHNGGQLTLRQGGTMQPGLDTSGASNVGPQQTVRQSVRGAQQTPSAFGVRARPGTAYY